MLKIFPSRSYGKSGGKSTSGSFQSHLYRQFDWLEYSVEKGKSLRAQLLFRKNILGQEADKKLFQLGENKKNYSIEELVGHVKELITISNKSSTPKSPWVGCRMIHYQMVQDQRTGFTGRIVSTVPGYPAWYNCVYTNDDAVYVYKLEDDFKAGDLIIEPNEG